MTIYGKGCISNYRNCSLSYVWYSVLYRMLTKRCKPRLLMIIHRLENYLEEMHQIPLIISIIIDDY